MTEDSTIPSSISSRAQEDQVTFLDILIVLAKRKTPLLAFALLGALASATVSLLLPNRYIATTKILPPQQSQTAAATMLAQLGSVASLVGGAATLKNSSDVYVAMLKSRTVADSLVQRFGLLQEYDVEQLSLARAELDKSSAIMAGKDGIITIDVDDKDPKRAADIANAYVDELMKLTQVLAVTEASQRRLFFERQFVQAKEDLVKAEVAARHALSQGGLVKVDDQGRAIIENMARLRAQITLKEVQIGAMRTFAADRNPDLQLAEQERESLKRELAKIEGNDGGKAASSDQSGRGIDNLSLLRNVKYHEAMFELLARQFELAKIDEAKDSSLIQVMDRAIPPDRKAKPRRSLIVLLSTLGAFVVGILWAIVLESFERAQGDPQQSARLRDFKRYLAWR